MHGKRLGLTILGVIIVIVAAAAIVFSFSKPADKVVPSPSPVPGSQR